MKIKVTTLPLCDRCVNRHECTNHNAKLTSCHKESSEPGQIYYKPDANVLERLADLNAHEVDAFLDTLDRTDREQITVTEDFTIHYKPRHDDIRRFNSRSNTTIRIKSDGLDLKRFCENCGAHFHTVNATRRLCDECHDEICEKLGVDYSLVPDWDKSKRSGGEE